jgi:hypothetical protein
VSISGNLPENGTAHTIMQDFVRPELLFVGTEFGIYFTIDNGENWIELKSGLPTIPVRDIAIQERENDLVIATFGRGFYILDDYSPLREVSADLENKDAYIFPVKDALMFVQTSGKSNQGNTYFTADNPEYGATFTYFLKEVPKTKAQLRKEEEKELFKEGKPIPQPSLRELQLEEQQEKTHLIFTIYDQDGNVVDQFTKAPSKGINRENWNMTYAATANTRIRGKFNPITNAGRGIMVMPGTYKVGLKMWHEGELTELVEPLAFTCKKLNNTTLPAEDYNENVEFAEKVNKLALAITGAGRMISENMDKVEQIKQAIYATPGASQELMDKARALGVELEELNFKMNGLPAKASGEEIPPAQVPLNDRLSNITYTHMGSTTGITATEKQAYDILTAEFPPVLQKLKGIVETDIPALEAELNKINAPWTPGRLIDWKE